MILQMIVNDTLLFYYNVHSILYVIIYIVYISDNYIVRTEPNRKKFKRRNYSIYSNTL